MSGERNTEKNSGFQMGTEPTTFRTLVGCSNHTELLGTQCWAGHLWVDITTASRSHIMSSEHTILTASRSRVNTLWAMNNKWLKWYVWREEYRKKNSKFQMGIEPTTFRTLVRFNLPLKMGRQVLKSLDGLEEKFVYNTLTGTCGNNYYSIGILEESLF